MGLRVWTTPDAVDISALADEVGGFEELVDRKIEAALAAFREELIQEAWERDMGEDL